MFEGWGLSRDTRITDKSRQRFYATDGSERLFVINPDNWTIE